VQQKRKKKQNKNKALTRLSTARAIETDRVKTKRTVPTRQMSVWDNLSSAVREEDCTQNTRNTVEEKKKKEKNTRSIKKKERTAIDPGDKHYRH